MLKDNNSNILEKEEEPEEDTEKMSNEENKSIKKENKKVNYERFLKDKDNIHYYHIDKTNKEWEFTEINGSKKKYYFKCSTKGCKGFGMINRIGDIKTFNLTKFHNLNYYEHTYYKTNKCINDLNKGAITKKEWENKNIRLNLFKWYFYAFKNDLEENCILFFKDKLKEIFVINDDIKTEIIRSKKSIQYTLNAKMKILSQLENLNDENNDKLTKTIQYEHYNKITKKNEYLFMYIIMNKSMTEEIKNKNCFQYFGDATYRCLPPTFRNYKLYIISGFNLIEKRTRILSYILLPNETEQTYLQLFERLKNDYGFYPKIFTMDFHKPSSKALKKIFPDIYIIKCFFHYVKSLFKNLKKYGLLSKEYKSISYEISYIILKN